MTNSAEGGPARQDIRVVDADGFTTLNETMSIVFYLRTPHLDMRKEIAQTIRDFATLVSFSALTSYVDYEGDEEDLDEQVLEKIIHDRFFAPGHFRNANISLVGGGFYARDFHLEYSGAAMDIPGVPDEASYFCCWVPGAFFREYRQRFTAFADMASARLPFTFGYVSPSLVGDDKRQRQALGARHPGLDLALPGPIALDIAGQAAGAYWINYTGSELTRQLGGANSIRRALPAEILVSELAGEKCRIVLGKDPQIGPPVE